MRFKDGNSRWSLAIILALAFCRWGRADEPPTDPEPDLSSIRAAVAKSLPLLMKAGSEEYAKHRDCFSCHNQGVPSVALRLAKSRGFPVDSEALSAIAELTIADLESAIDEYRKGKGQPGGIDRAGYALWTLEMTAWEPDETTDAVAHYLEKAQQEAGQWLSKSNRPPSEASDFTATYLALRAEQAFGKSRAQKDPTAKPATSRARALAWLRESKPRETEDHVFRLWGMKYAGASDDELQSVSRALLESQRADGGWRQLSGEGEGVGYSSDAYATGSVLVVLNLVGGLETSSESYRRGLHFLLKSQLPDGSWLVKSRSKPFQPYFESGFPHGKDQFISAAGSAWATAALVLACPASPPTATATKP